MKQRCSVPLPLSLACFLAIMLLLDACTSKPPPAGIRFPITHGFHTLLPTEQQRILIWGDPPSIDVAEEWLRSHHYSPIQASPQQVRSGFNQEAVLRLAVELGAEFVLILEREELKTGALLESPCRVGFNLSVTVRGLSPGSGKMVFRGSAYYPHCVERARETLENLTCQALATAWGFRPSGQLDLPSSLACTTGQVPLSSTH